MFTSNSSLGARWAVGIHFDDNYSLRKHACTSVSTDSFIHLEAGKWVISSVANRDPIAIRSSGLARRLISG